MAGTIRVLRVKDRLIYRARRFIVVINGEKSGAVRRGSTVDFSVPEGPFSVRVGVDWSASPTLSGTIRNGEVVTLVTGVGQWATGLTNPRACLILQPAPQAGANQDLPAR